MHPGEFAHVMNRAATQLPSTMRAAVMDYAQNLEGDIKRRQGHPPAPRAPHGDYRRSWTHTPGQAGNIASADVHTSAPQAKRLEFGFTGPDRLGRVYHQAPRPHVAPAIEATTKEWEKTWKGAIDSALG